MTKIALTGKNINDIFKLPSLRIIIKKDDKKASSASTLWMETCKSLKQATSSSCNTNNTPTSKK